MCRRKILTNVGFYNLYYRSYRAPLLISSCWFTLSHSEVTPKNNKKSIFPSKCTCKVIKTWPEYAYRCFNRTNIWNDAWKYKELNMRTGLSCNFWTISHIINVLFILIITVSCYCVDGVNSHFMTILGSQNQIFVRFLFSYGGQTYEN